MPKNEVSRFWFIAVDGEKNFLRQKWEDYKPPSGAVKRLFVVHHSGEKGDNSHTHALLEETESVQKQSLDKRLKNYFEVEKLTKMRSYSSKSWDGNASGEGAGSYCFHEERAEIIFNMGISDEDISIMRKANAQVQKVVAINKQRASNKLVEKAYNEFLLYPLPEAYQEQSMMQFKAKVLAFMLKEIKHGRAYHPGNGRLKMLVEEVEIKKSPEQSLDSMARNLAEKFWGERV